MLTDCVRIVRFGRRGDCASQRARVCRPTLRTWIAKRGDLETASREFFGLLADGSLRIDIAAKLPLRQAARAHELLEGRALRGAVLLEP